MRASSSALRPLMLAIACLLAGCMSPVARAPVGGGAALATRNNCYSLLHQLLDEQKDVSLLRFIKREHAGVKDLVKRIAAASGAGADLLSGFAKADPSISLVDFRLPPGEAATREAIASTKQKELLGRSGDDFELRLLLTQDEALGYAQHLARVAAENEPSTGRAHALTAISEDMGRLDQELVGLLLAKWKGSAKSPVRPVGK